MKRVPIHTPSAPSASDAASPRPSNSPPAATTGTCSPTASTTCGTSAIVATVPVCPPASVPWATTKSTPLATALTAWRTLPHMLPTRMFLRVQQVDDLARHAEAGDEDARAAVDHALDAVLDLARHRGQQVDAERLARSARGPWPSPRAARRRPSSTRPSVPIPPASLTAATRAVVADAAHAGEHDRVFDVEQLGQAGAHAATVATTARVRAPAAGRGVGRPGRRSRPRCQRDGVSSSGAGLVLEHPPGEVAARPVARRDARGPRRVRRARMDEDRLSDADIRWSATRWWRTSVSYAARTHCRVAARRRR